MMNHGKLINVLDEIERFKGRVKEYEDALKNDVTYCQPKQSGALRRASMDLTRALAELRKPG